MFDIYNGESPKGNTKMRLEASDRIMIKTYFEKRQNLNESETQYVERMVREIVFDYASLGIKKGVTNTNESKRP